MRESYANVIVTMLLLLLYGSPLTPAALRVIDLVAGEQPVRLSGNG